MRKLIFLAAVLSLSNFCFGADWVYVTESSDADTDYYIDKSYYKYDSKTGVSEVWYKVNKFRGLSEYTDSKNLSAYDCINKKARTLAQANYTYEGYSNKTTSKPTPYSVIFPDSVGEDLWLAACKTKGKGLYLPHKPNFISEKRMELIGLKPEGAMDDLHQLMQNNPK